MELNLKYPRGTGKYPMGLYIEVKESEYYYNNKGINVEVMLYNILQKYNIDTYSKAEQKLPIIIQSFSLKSLIYFKYLTDLPTTFLMSFKQNTTWTLEQLRDINVVDIVGIDWQYFNSSTSYNDFG